MTYPPVMVAEILRERAQALRARAIEARRRAEGCRAAATHERNASGYRSDMDASSSLLQEAQQAEAGALYLESQACAVEQEQDHG